VELQAGREIWADALHLKGLNDKPLLVISRGTNLDYEWSTYQADLATLSKNSRHITIDGANHSTLVFDQQYAFLVSDAILNVVEAVRNGLRLDQ
jgi:hypothetical protein